MAGRVPAIVGVSAPGLAPIKELAASAMDLGAAGVMVALRQSEGLMNSIMRMLEIDLPVPDHTTLSRRACGLPVPERARIGTDDLRLIVDSTGLKLRGAGEWLFEKHGTAKRRAWRKLHIGFDADSGQIVAFDLTGAHDLGVARRYS
jgi:Transposase DDE domain